MPRSHSRFANFFFVLFVVGLVLPQTAHATLIGDTVTGALSGVPDFTSNTAVVTDGSSPTPSGSEFVTDLLGPLRFRLAADFQDTDGTRLSIAWARFSPTAGAFPSATWTFGDLDLLGDPDAPVVDLIDLGGTFEVLSFGVVDDSTIQVQTAAISQDNNTGGQSHFFRIVFDSDLPGVTPIPEPGTFAIFALGLTGPAVVRRRSSTMRGQKSLTARLR